MKQELQQSHSLNEIAHERLTAIKRSQHRLFDQKPTPVSSTVEPVKRRRKGSKL